VAIERALISVFDKTGVVEFARQLAARGVEIVSTGGTAKLLGEAGVRVGEVARLTGWPEMLGGRVKTLHPKVHGGILFRRGHPDDRRQAAEHGLVPIDLVVVNLYPFETAAARPSVTAEELIENIDIGGPALVRSAAKNFQSVAVVTEPRDYPRILEEMGGTRELSLGCRVELARKAFAMTARYDAGIAMELERVSVNAQGDVAAGERPRFPENLFVALKSHSPLRYGENPHQRAMLYQPAGPAASGLLAARQLQGKELSYNNLMDLATAWRAVCEFARPAAVIIKHANPCGAAEQETLLEAYQKACACDPFSAYGGVVAFNLPLDGPTAEEVSQLFTECIVAPGYDSAGREKLSAKKNLRLLELPAPYLRGGSGEPGSGELDGIELKSIPGGCLAQEPDRHVLSESELRVVSYRPPTPEELRALRFAWKVCKYVKSNAIVFARDGQTLGIGAGQMSRVDSVKIAAMKAKLPLAGSGVASDAFFPFPDGVEEAAKAGARAVIQPGGSVRDQEVIAACNRLGLAMVFTGTRCFRH